MKWKTTLSALALAAVAFAPAALQAQDHGGMDFTGKWELEFPAPWGIVVWAFDLEQDGVEVSGKSSVAVEGDIDVAAPNGLDGETLLDPLFYIIVPTGPLTGTLVASRRISTKSTS